MGNLKIKNWTDPAYIFWDIYYVTILKKVSMENFYPQIWLSSTNSFPRDLPTEIFFSKFKKHLSIFFPTDIDFRRVDNGSPRHRPRH